MGSVGDAYDNAMCESFFATLECRLIKRHSFWTLGEAQQAVFRFIEGWYNPRRRASRRGSEERRRDPPGVAVYAATPSAQRALRDRAVKVAFDSERFPGAGLYTPLAAIGPLRRP